MNIENIANYETMLTPKRDAFLANSNINVLLQDSNDKKLIMFFVVFCYFGIPMTKTVESWIRRSGEATVDKGFEALGTKLAKHAKGEANHDKMYERDVVSLLSYLNSEMGYALTATDLAALTPPKSIQDYIDIHEDNITSDTPYDQVSIEYEIENLSVKVGPVICELAENIFGEKAESYLSFLYHHVELDVGHTKFNRKLLSDLIAQVGSDDTLITTGLNALTIYENFISECIVVSQTLLTQAEQRYG